MEKNDIYIISFYIEIYWDVLKYCGSYSGEDVDKVKGVGLIFFIIFLGSKVFFEVWMIIECKKMLFQLIIFGVFDILELKEVWKDKFLYMMYIGEIMNVWVK